MAALPASAELQTLERSSRRLGTGLGPADLVGIWRLHQVWPRKGGEPSGPSSALLRSLGARLEINTASDPSSGPSSPWPGPPGDPGSGQGLRLVNAVHLGPLELRFVGRARLAGPRPLLWFGFDQLQLGLGARVLLQRNLPPAPSQRQPFFALIGKGDGWLAARGRGGGLALWRLEASAAP